MTERDLIGYGARPPKFTWPGGARTAVSIVINYEEGGELCQLNGDAMSEARLTDLAGTVPVTGSRDMEVESLYEFGSRVGIWRLVEIMKSHNLPFTAFAVGRALELNPAVADAVLAAGGELVPHGWRWIDYQHVEPAVEKEHIERCVALFTRLAGERPLGWYTGRNSPQTRRLVVEEGGFLYDSDAYNDEIPYWDRSHGKPHLVVPYTLDANDGRLAAGGDFATAEQFGDYLCDAFDWLHSRADGRGRMLSVGLHARIIARPGRIGSLVRFLDHVARQSNVYVCRRLDIAKHWIDIHPAETAA